MMTNVCRLCLRVQKRDNLTGNIFQDETARFINEIFHTQLLARTQWPTEACKKCHSFVMDIRSFREEVLNAQSTLNDMESEALDEEPITPNSPTPADPTAVDKQDEIEPAEEISLLVAEDDLVVDELMEDVTEDVVTVPQVSIPEKPPTTRRTRSSSTLQPQSSPVKRSPRKSQSAKSCPATPARTSTTLHFSSDDQERMEAGMRELGWLTCHICGEETGTVQDFNKHFHANHDSYGYITCCKGKRRAGVQLFEHYLYHQDDKAFKCDFCESTFRTRSLVKTHQQSFHPDDSTKQYECDKCDKVYTHLGRFNNHKKRHELPAKCSYCGKGFCNNKQLTRHIQRMHEIAKRAECQKCHKWFSSQDTLEVHLKRHRWSENKQPCPHCNKLVADIKQHVDIVHLGKRRGGIIRIPGLDSQGRPLAPTEETLETNCTE